jgi:hypothetical protein
MQSERKTDMNPTHTHRIPFVAVLAAAVLAGVAATSATAAPAGRPATAVEAPQPPVTAGPAGRVRGRHGLRSLQSATSWGTIGEYVSANGGCVNRRVIVTAPQLRAVRVDFGNLIGAQNQQWVAWRPWVYRAESREWTPGAWLAKEVVTDGFSTFDTAWLNLSTGQWQDGVSEFSINAAGTYSVYVEYYWYANQYVGAGGTGEFLTLVDDDRGPLPVYGPSCRYSS